MESIKYVGEHLWPGQLGHLMLILGFAGSLFATIAYFFATQNRAEPTFKSWRNLGRIGFLIHSLGILAVIGILFFIMTQKYYEYQYVQAHVSDDLPFKYIFSAFWEGQEGSFLLWMFWHIVLGLIILFVGSKWESPVLSTLSFIQLFINSMILGVYVGFGEHLAKIGSNPLLLLRDVMDAPIFGNAEYVKLISGTGINTLLQNYWMTIHPPTLFLGFASTSIPFAFAVAGLWTGEHKAWLKPALPWALFSGAILGLGILMGGAWAYEALSFGGYWAWDPVENMSLVPWLIMIAGLHTNLIARNTGYALKTTYIYYLLSFILIVYSTFLTRSGVLGETSVHAFTQMGLEWQLVSFIGVFLLLSAGLYLSKRSQIPTPEQEEKSYSREFWMFIGSLVLLFSALIISGSTSLPVYNKIMQYFDPSFEGRVITDPVPHYNKYQIWIALFMGLLSGAAQYLRYRGVNWTAKRAGYLTRIGVTLALSGILAYLTTLWINIYTWQYWVLLFSGIFAVLANLDYLINFLKGNLKTGASSIAHIGFGVMIVGILASGLNQKVISSNPFIMEGIMTDSREELAKKNIMLFKGVTVPMSGYDVTYTSDTIDKFNRTYTINFKKRNESGKVIEDFNLQPNIVYSRDFTKIEVPNPSTRRYLTKDMFTVISALPEVEINFEFRKQREDSLNYRTILLSENQIVTFNDTVSINDLVEKVNDIRTYELKLISINRNPVHKDYKPEPGDLAVSAVLEVKGKQINQAVTIEPLIVLRGQLLYQFPAQINELDTKIKLKEQIFEQIFAFEEDLKYEEFSIKKGEQVSIEGHVLNFQGFNRSPNNPAYKKEEGDIAVGAIFQVTDANGAVYQAEPVYFIRGNRPLNVKDQIDPLGLHLRFNSLDPKTESMQLLVARTDPKPAVVPIEMATNSLRSDWIVLQATEFPGINLFWGGSLMMILGLTLGVWHRMQKVSAHQDASSVSEKEMEGILH